MKKTTIAIIIAAAAALALAAALLTLTATTGNAADERIELPEECSYDGLRDTLLMHRVLATKGRAAWAFGAEARMLGLDKSVRPGSYLVPHGMKVLDLVRKLRNGQQDPIRLTIGKFRTPQQLDAYLAGKLMHNDFDIAIDSFHLVIPDTYEFYWTVSPAQFMRRMSDEYARVESSRWKDGNDVLRDFRDVVILASIVEEETNYGPEKPLIASVYLNRLRRGMPLQADPTVKYAVGDFTLQRILNRHLATESPYNTYLHQGLPPAPICLPSKASIDAVVNAPATDYLYFCASDMMDGTHRFASTLAEHNRNAQRFHAALNRKGIR